MDPTLQSLDKLPASEIFTPIALPCGRIVPNRLVKVPLYEHAANFSGGPPNQAHLDLYSRWANGQWGMIMTGNVQVASDHLTFGRDMVIPTEITHDALEPFRRLATAMHGEAGESSPARQSAPLAIMQLSHAGRQSLRFVGGRGLTGPPLAPSPIRVGAPRQGSRFSTLEKIMNATLFVTPKEITSEDIDNVIASFTRGAQVAAKSGLDGVQLHAAHGYLLAEFLSPKSNERTDEYAVHDNPLLLLRHIAASIRAPGVVPDHFVVGVKLNVADYVDTEIHGENTDKAAKTHAQHERALNHVREIASWGYIDFIEISGGDYESPAFMSDNISPRQALFSKFSKRALQVLSQSHSEHSSTPLETSDRSGLQHKSPLILLTGGLRAEGLLSSVLSQKHAHLLGIGRLSVTCPDLPRLLYHSLQGDTTFSMESIPTPDLAGVGHPPSSWVTLLEQAFFAMILWLYSFAPFKVPPLSIGGVTFSWYAVAMRNIAKGEDPDYSIGGPASLIRLWLWSAPDATLS